MVTDAEEPSVPDNIDILSVGYQHDATYAYFEIRVQDGTGHRASFSSDRYYVYTDINGDGHSDRLLRNTAAKKATLDNWSGTQWVTYGSAWCEDPDASPDNHLYLACYLSDLNSGNFTIIAAAEDNPNFQPTMRDPQDNPSLNDITGDSSNPTPVVASDFAVARAGDRLSFRWQAGADARLAGFNVYAASGAEATRVNLNGKLIPARPPLAEASYVFTWRGKRLGAQQYELEAVSLDGSAQVVARASPPAR